MRWGKVTWESAQGADSTFGRSVMWKQCLSEKRGCSVTPEQGEQPGQQRWGQVRKLALAGNLATCMGRGEGQTGGGGRKQLLDCPAVTTPAQEPICWLKGVFRSENYGWPSAKCPQPTKARPEKLTTPKSSGLSQSLANIPNWKTNVCVCFLLWENRYHVVPMYCTAIILARGLGIMQPNKQAPSPFSQKTMQPDPADSSALACNLQGRGYRRGTKASRELESLNSQVRAP